MLWHRWEDPWCSLHQCCGTGTCQKVRTGTGTVKNSYGSTTLMYTLRNRSWASDCMHCQTNVLLLYTVKNCMMIISFTPAVYYQEVSYVLNCGFTYTVMSSIEYFQNNLDERKVFGPVRSREKHLAGQQGSYRYSVEFSFARVLRKYLLRLLHLPPWLYILYY